MVESNCIIVNVQKMCPSPLQDAQQSIIIINIELLLDFRIRDTPDEETKFSAIEHLLR